MYTYSPLFLDFFPILVPTEYWAGLPVPYIRFSLVIYFMHSVSMCQSRSTNLSHFPLVYGTKMRVLFPACYPHVCSLHLCLYFCFASKVIYTIFYRFHIYPLTYSIFLFVTYFTFWKFPGPSTSLQMIQFHSFLWLSTLV